MSDMFVKGGMYEIFKILNNITIWLLKNPFMFLADSISVVSHLKIHHMFI